MLISCYCRQKKAGVKPRKEITKEDIAEGLASVITVYKSSKEKIDAFRAFAKDRYLSASAKCSEKKPELPKSGGSFFSLVPKH